MSPPPLELVVRPRHCDAQGMLHAARYYEFFEEGFLQWLEAAGLPYPALREGGVDLVIVRSGCVHHRPAALDDVVSITVTAAEIGRSSFTAEFALEVADAPVATGTTTYVAVRDGRSTPLAGPLLALLQANHRPPGADPPRPS